MIPRKAQVKGYREVAVVVVGLMMLIVAATQRVSAQPPIVPVETRPQMALQLRLLGGALRSGFSDFIVDKRDTVVYWTRSPGLGVVYLVRDAPEQLEEAKEILRRALPSLVPVLTSLPDDEYVVVSVIPFSRDWELQVRVRKGEVLLEDRWERFLDKAE